MLSGYISPTRCGWVFDHSRVPDRQFGIASTASSQVDKSGKFCHPEPVVRTRYANLRIRTVRWRVHGVRRPVHAAPAAERGAVDPLPGLPEARA